VVVKADAAAKTWEGNPWFPSHDPILPQKVVLQRRVPPKAPSASDMILLLFSSKEEDVGVYGSKIVCKCIIVQ